MIALPAGFEDYFRRVWDGEMVDALVCGLDEEVPVSIRINPARLPADAWPEGGESRVPWCSEGIYLNQRPQFTADPLLHAGAYYVQEASSMFLAHVLRQLNVSINFQKSASTVLDLCAAPGGKSTILRSLLPPEAMLVSNEPLRQRAQVLAENMAKWGSGNVVVTQAYAKDITRVANRDRLFAGFDNILADVPCSGEGMMRKEDEARRQWSPQFVADCAALQRSIVEDIWPALRPGGFMIYSTCTFNPEEDECNVEWIARELGADIIPISVDSSWHILGDLRRHSLSAAPLTNPSSLANADGQLSSALPFCHFIPGLVRGEGFFCALLQKHGESDGESKNAHFIDSIAKNLTVLPTDLLDSPEGNASSSKRAGKGSDAAIPRVEISLVDAFRYLQREAIALPPDAPRGIVQLCYHGQRLGLAKNIGSRANNLYPKEWRIRSGHFAPHTLFP